MPTFSAHDGTKLAYHVSGEGLPLICLPGGPMQDSDYLEELGGLSAHRQLVLVDPRGTGQSAIPRDTSSYRCDRLVDDVEALRDHLGLERLDLLAHSAGTNLAVLYASRHPERVRKLALITPSTRAVGIEVTAESRLETARLRKNEPWYGPAFATLEAMVTGNATEATREAINPFFYGRWNAKAQAHHASQDGRRNDDAAALFGTEGTFAPDTTRAALATFTAPVLVLAGELDLNTPPQAATELAALFPNATLIIQPESGHFPWIDTPTQFVATTTTFLK